MLLSPIVDFFQARQFTFRPIYSFVMVLGISVCTLAAVWQYQKAIFYTQPQNQLMHIQGQYLNEYQHFLDNQTHNGQVGYAVIVPFLYDSTVYLVNRGFVPYKNRHEMPNVPEVNGIVQLVGRLYVNHKPLLLNTSLVDPIENRIQFVDRQFFETQLQRPVNSELFVLREGAGLLVKTKEKEPYLNHHKHQAYALQWILLAIAGVIIWLFASMNKNENKDATA